MSLEHIRVAGITKESIVDGIGLRTVIFAQGCHHNCEGCHNPSTHPYDGGELIHISDIFDEYVLNNPLIDGITCSGGEPFSQAIQFYKLCEKVKSIGKTVWCYTGHTFEFILDNYKNILGWDKFLNNIDVIVDGPFLLVEKDLTLSFRGSRNQRIIDVKESLKQNKVILLKGI